MQIPEGKFWGFRRPDGSVGIRNHVLLLPTIVCAAKAAQQVTQLVRGTVSFYHQHGCAAVGADIEQTNRTFVGTGAHPNVSGVVVMGLGCEASQARLIAAEIARRAPWKRVEVVLIQESGGTLQAIADAASIAAAMVKDASLAQRELIDVSELILATECGGSDACSGLSGNPAVGACSDLLIDRGGTVILAETTELIGAEHLLAERAVTPALKKRVFEVIDRFEQDVMKMGVDFRGAQPSPGNIEGGITTIEEKSLGCIYKAGTRPLQDIIEYAERPKTRGLVWMDTPGHDIEQITGMVAGGAHVTVFTSGRGTPTGSVVAPAIKIATNSPMFERMRDNMDVNAGTVISGEETVQTVGRRIFEEVRAVASGKLTSAEILGQDDFGIWRIGPTL
ncbi:MAG TPA: UxaA family hydrolase [Symbiobacteriaceae bacterium]|nr:UxaA family hydrolase [Symbiobacteriaceae bacterium]